ncbi:MAG TPA: BatA domain-containing protein [Sedimentisphaerales bacterium]|nr:BatA domain-containing protein [Sedimentisphaerales bacterium]HRS11385.1 BatA domain-containing protein [Sedimentisphaerales bacterium]HRV47957.1 BatA domain-containing protein [Sedimentisphaerales bacterium]
MSFLHPLFLAGVAAIGVPILLHMIRRHTRKRITFSSLMFVRTTAPRLRNRSRIENLSLLILRCLLLGLLALAFARPLLSRQAPETVTHQGRRMVLLVDTSASMRRAGLWNQAIAEVRSVLSDIQPTDRLCLMTFDRGAKTQIGFDQWVALDLPQRAAAVMDCLADLSPGWASTDLGGALATAAEALEDDAVSDSRQTGGVRQIVLISDLQQGSRLDALQTYEWPETTELLIRPVVCRSTTNAALEWVIHRDHRTSADANDAPTIRVINTLEATVEQFQLRWTHEPTEPAFDVYVPAGRSFVVKVPTPRDSSTTHRLILAGDDHDFDNTLYIAPRLQQQIRILCISNDEPNDPRGMLYYVRQAFKASGRRNAQVTFRRTDETLVPDEVAAAHLVVLTEAAHAENLGALRRHVEAGGSVLLAMKSTTAATVLSALAGIGNINCEEANAGRYAMLGQIEFAHPLLSVFADPRFGDFTKVHFWKYRRVDLAVFPDARVLAWYDSDDPAWFEVPRGRGTVVVMTSGWQPADSDLALSSKFVPLLYSILEYGGALAGTQAQYFVGDAVPVARPAASPSENVRIRKPDGSTVVLDRGAETFTQTDMPGIYGIESAGGTRPFAVNVPVSESRTDPMEIEELEKRGLSLKPLRPVATGPLTKVAIHRGMAETESEQKLWRWVLVAALIVLWMETWLAGWLTRPASGPQGEST